MAILKQSTAYTRMFMMIDSSDHVTGKTGLTVTLTLSKAGAAFAAAGGAVTEVSSGWYKLALSTTDTNTIGDLAYHCTSTGADPTDFVDQVSARIIDDLAYPATSGRSMVVDASGLVDANVVKIGPTGSGTAQTARDIGASVLLSSGTGTGQLNFTSGVVDANLAQILGTALTETAGQIAAAFKKFFNIASPTSTMNEITLVDTVTTATNLTNNNDKTNYSLTTGERNSVADSLLDRDMSLGADNGSTTVRTPRQALRALRNKWAVVAGTCTIYKEDDATSSWTSTVTTTAGTSPVTSSDPAG